MIGLIHIYEGYGKGKTSAGVGLSIRCAGSGQKVLYTQFLKNDCSNELNILQQIEEIDVLHCKKDFGFIFNLTTKEKEEAKVFYEDYFDEIVDIITKENYRMLVLDEIIDAYNLNLVNKTKVLDFLKNKPENLEVVLTGRDPVIALTNLADYISNINKIRHPYDRGITARVGIEY